MIRLHKLNGSEVIINVDLLESIESVPDTKIILTTGNQYIVKETSEEIIKKVIEYKAKIELEKENQKQEILNQR